MNALNLLEVSSAALLGINARLQEFKFMTTMSTYILPKLTSLLFL